MYDPKVSCYFQIIKIYLLFDSHMQTDVAVSFYFSCNFQIILRSYCNSEHKHIPLKYVFCLTAICKEIITKSINSSVKLFRTVKKPTYPLQFPIIFSRNPMLKLQSSFKMFRAGKMDIGSCSTRNVYVIIIIIIIIIINTGNLFSLSKVLWRL